MIPVLTSLPQQTIRLERDEEIMVVELNRPDALNALNNEMLAEIDAVLTASEGEPAIRGLLFVGAGRAFAAGADVTELRNLQHDDMLEHPMPTLYARLRESPLATAAAVHGFALGGGFELALSCDVRVLGDSAELGLPELSLGIVPGAGGTQLLARSVGESRALDLILTGKRIRAHEAEAWGLASAVCPDTQLRDRGVATLRRILRHSNGAITTAKRLVRQAVGTAEGYHAEVAAQAQLHATPDAQEGMEAFTQRRQPRFTNEPLNSTHK